MPQEHHFFFKYILLGDGGVGKSSLFWQFTERTFVSPMVRNDFACHVCNIDNKKVKMQFWDTPGRQEGCTGITRGYYRCAVGALLVYDVTRRETFVHLPDWLGDIRTKSKTATTVMLIGNKSDLDNKRQVSCEEGEQFAKDNGLVFMETSAKTAQNVDEAFLRTANVVYENVQNGVIDPTVVLGKPQGAPEPQPKLDGRGDKRCCCTC